MKKDQDPFNLIVILDQGEAWKDFFVFCGFSSIAQRFVAFDFSDDGEKMDPAF